MPLTPCIPLCLCLCILVSLYPFIIVSSHLFIPVLLYSFTVIFKSLYNCILLLYSCNPCILVPLYPYIPKYLFNLMSIYPFRYIYIYILWSFYVVSIKGAENSQVLKQLSPVNWVWTEPVWNNMAVHPARKKDNSFVKKNKNGNIESKILIGCAPCTTITVYTLPAARKRLL